MAKAGFAQYEVKFGRREENFATIRRKVEEARDADLLVLPELGATGYEFVDRDEVADLAEQAGHGPTSDLLRELSNRYGMDLVIGYPERDGDRFYNSCMLVQPDGSLTNYRKLHLFSRENELFSPGDAPPPVVETKACRVGMMICFDWFFPEVARLLALNGAQIIAHPSNLVLTFCQRAMFARSVENGVFSITANRTGTEERAGRSLTFTGQSQVLDTRGEALATASPTEDCVRLVELEPTHADHKQINPHNHLLHSRRIDVYGDLLNASLPRGQ